ncbi:MAG: type I glutamate--ammonia ligase [Candidatus Eisenbacteria bacterium]
MFRTPDEVAAYLKERGIQMIDLKFSDLPGRWHHVTIPASQWGAKLIQEGVGFDGSALGLKSVKSGDMVLRPDLSTGFIDPFCQVPTLSFISTAFEADTRAPFASDPRNLASRAAAYLRETGIADRSVWGPEYEFYVFDRVAYENGVNASGYRVESREADWRSGEGGHGHLIPLHGGYHAIPPKDQLHDLRSEMCVVLEAMDVPVKYHHHEVGGPGQCEIEVPMTEFLRAADGAQLVKYVTRMVAHRHGQTATFMPKPLYGEAGNGMHFHQHLFRGDTNLFYEPGAYANLSQLALHYVAGLLLHGPALLAFTNPSTNSYRRLVPGYEAPVNAFFSLGNRSAAIRVPKYADQPETTRIEFRPPDATANVYLAMAAQLMAGIDGIKRKLDPSALGFGPIDRDVFSMSEAERRAIKSLPRS